MNTYICFYHGKKIEVHARTTLGARVEAARVLRVPPGKGYLITVILAVTEDGHPVVHTPDF